MKLFELQKELENGNKIKRKSGRGINIGINFYLFNHFPFSLEDLFADDWEVC